MSLAKVWTYASWIPRGIPKAMANELSSAAAALAHPEAIARVAQLESQGKNPYRVARAEFWQMYLACWPYRFRNTVVEWETCKAKVLKGSVDLQDIVDLLYLLAWAYLFWILGEIYGRGSLYGYRFDGEIHRQEAQNVILYKEKEAQEMAVVMEKLEKEIQEWLKTMEQE
uniref:ATPEG1 n=1 Tax=Euglena gracilis TaxID=3039 RepID=UPI0012B67DA2|nr:Chain 0, ATPEG1 [Euglena gracilis]